MPILSRHMQDAELEKTKRRIRDALLFFANCRRNVARELRRLAHEIDCGKSSVQTVKLAGQSMVICGTGISIGGFAASFVTAGVSLILSFVGLVLAAIGGIASTVGSLVLKGISKTIQHEANMRLQRDRNALEEALRWIRHYKRFCREQGIHVTNEQPTMQPKLPLQLAKVDKRLQPCNTMLSQCKQAAQVGYIMTNSATVGYAGYDGVQLLIEGADDVANATGETLATVFSKLKLLKKVFHIGSGVYNLLFLPYDIYSLVRLIVAMYSGREVKLKVALLETARKLEEDIPTKEEVEDIIDKLDYINLE